MSDLETVSLDMGGNFAAQAAAAAVAAREASAAVDKLMAPRPLTLLDSLKATAKEADATAKALQKLADAEERDMKSAQRDAQAHQASQLKMAQQAQKESAEQSTASYEAAGTAVAAGGVIVLAAAVALAKSAADLLEAGFEFGVKMSAAHDKQVGILDHLQKGQGEALYKLSLEVAGDTGLSPDEAVSKMTELIHAGFSKDQSAILIKAEADLGAVKGAEAGKALLETLEKAAETGHATEKSMKALAAAGVNNKDVLAALAHTGESVAQVDARLKAGKVSAEEFAKAVGSVVEKDVGGVAGSSVDALLNKVKIQVGELFSGFDLSPLKGALKTISDVLSSPVGDELKKSFGDAGSEAVKALFGPFQGPEGKQRLTDLATTVSSTMKEIGKDFHDAAPGIQAFLDATIAVGKFSAGFDTGGGLLGALIPIYGMFKLAEAGAKAFEAALEAVARAAESVGIKIGPVKDLGNFAAPPTAALLPAVGPGANDAGNALSQGMADGIDAGASKAIDAAARMAASALQAAEDKLQVASPSKAFHFLGDMSGEGLAKGMNDNDAPASAGKAMAASALGAASGGVPTLAGSTGGASGGGGGSISIAITQHLPPGSPAETQAAAKSGTSAALPEILAALRRAQRDAHEAA